MCDPGKVAGPVQALAMLDGALEQLNSLDMASMPTAVQAELLRGLERAESRHTAARARVLAAFTAQDGYEADGQGGARVWLKWQTRVTAGAAAGAVGWARRLARHPVVEQALATGELSSSWARLLCAWSDRLPEERRDDADQILCAAATSARDAWAVGDFSTGTATRTLVLHWDGSAWRRVITPSLGGSVIDNALTGVGATSSGNVWAAGHYFNGTNPQTLALHCC